MRQKLGDKLYKISKIKYKRKLDPDTNTYGEYEEIDRVVSFSTHKNAVSQTLKAAESGNNHVESRETIQNRGSWTKYGTIIEVADMPEFKLFD